MIITLYFLNGFLNFNFLFGHFPCPVTHMKIELDGCSQGRQQAAGAGVYDSRSFPLLYSDLALVLKLFKSIETSLGVSAIS